MIKGEILLSRDIYIFKKRFHISVITLDEKMPGFPCTARIRIPKKNEPWYDVTILNHMLSLGW